MKRIVLFFFCLLFLLTNTAIANQPTKTEATRENLLEDAVIDLLQPQLYEAVKDFYGTTYDKAFQCLKVVNIKKLYHPGSWLFEATLEGMTYSGVHNPLDIFTVTVKKDWGDSHWVLKDNKLTKYDPNQEYECRDPA